MYRFWKRSTGAFGGGAPFLSADLLSTAVAAGVGELTVPAIGDADYNRLSLDNEGIWRPVLAEELRQKGQRRVENLVEFSEDFSQSAWVKGRCTATTDTITCNSTNVSGFTVRSNTVSSGGTNHIFAVEMKKGTNDFGLMVVWDNSANGCRAWFDLDTGVIGSVNAFGSGFTTANSAMQDMGDGWFRCYMMATNTAGTVVGQIYPSVPADLDFDGTDGDVGYLRKAQLEDSTGRTDTTTPSEYISTGVGTGSELVTNGDFTDNTDDWTASAGGILTVDTQRAKLTNDGTGSNVARMSQPMTTVIGGTYIAEVEGTIGTLTLTLAVSNNADLSSAITTDTSASSGKLTLTFVATATTTYVGASNSAVNANGHNFYDDFTFKQIDHGANVDGVAYYTTENGNTVSSNVVTEAQGAAIAITPPQYVELSGNSGSYVSTPDSAAVSITGDIDIVCTGVASNDFTSTQQFLASKSVSSGSQRSYFVSIEVNGTVTLGISTAGSSFDASVTTTTAPTLTDGANNTIRVTRVAATGSVEFIINGVSFETKVGTTGNIFDSTAPLLIGGISATGSFAGGVATVKIYNGIDGTLAAEFNAADGNWQTPKTVPSGYQSADLPGASGDYISTPDSADLDVLGDATWIVYATADDWTPAATMEFQSRWGVSVAASSWLFRLNTDGTLALIISDGSTGPAATSSAATGISDGVGSWIKATRAKVGGVTKFYLSSQANTVNPLTITNWAQLGTDQAVHADTDINASAKILEVGSQTSGTLNLFTGEISRSIFLSGINGTLVADFNANDYVSGTTLRSSETLELWTLNGNASILGQYTVNGDAYLETDNTDGSPELIVNGTFDTNVDGWTETGGVGSISWDAGALKITNGASETVADMDAPIATVVGQEYIFSVENPAASDGTIRIKVGTSLGGGQYADLNTIAVGDTSVVKILATSTALYVRLQTATATASATRLMDNVTVKPVAINYYAPLGYMAQGTAVELSGYSADLTNASWANTASVAQDEVGLTGQPNEAFTVTDASAIVADDIRHGTVTVSGTDTYYVMARVKYDAAPSVYPRIFIQMSNGGCAVNQALVLDPSDGSYVETATAGEIISVIRNGDFWEVLQAVTDNASGNLQVLVIIDPAYNSDGTVTEDVTAQGSTVFASCELYKTTWSYQPLLTTGGSTKTLSNDEGATLDLANFNDSAGSMEFVLTPEFDTAPTSGTGAVTPNATAFQFVYFTTSGARSITLRNGAVIDSVSNAWVLGDTITIKARWGGGTMRLSVDGTLADEGAYDGSFSPSGAITLFLGLTLGAEMKDLKIWSTDLSNDWL